MRGHRGVVPTVVHTGQSHDARKPAACIAAPEIPPPDFALGVDGASHAEQTAEVMRRLEPILNTTRADLVLVMGDGDSTLAAALTAVKLGIPVAHVEAGLRAVDRRMPEEINRRLTDVVSDYLFVTEASGEKNLLSEGIPPAKVHFVGSVTSDAVRMFRPHWEGSSIFDRLGLDADRPYAVLTLRRPCTVDDPVVLMNFLEAFHELARDLPVIFPLHPRLKQQLRRHGYICWTSPDFPEPVDRKGLVYLDPLGYFDFVALMSRASLVLTDSGAIQDETTALGVPCLTLRESTERPITVTHGTNRLIGAEPTCVVAEALHTLECPPRPTGQPPLWDGQAARRIVRILADHEARRDHA
jgi:UDP-N-acetylglucosamine 2-epimerase (non-hydrolysing)